MHDLEELYLSSEEVKKYKTKMLINNILMYTFLTLIAFFIVFPFLYMVTTSFKSEVEVTSDRFIFFPSDYFSGNYKENGKVLGPFANYIKVLSINEKKYSVLTMYYSTILVSIFTTIGTVITVVLGAFESITFKFTYNIPP